MDSYIGEIRQVGFTYAPYGWLMCDGSLQLISENQALYTLLGTTYGGDGSKTFGLPDLRGRCPLGQGSGPKGTYVLGAKGGTESVSLTSLQLPEHTHQIKASSVIGTGSPAGSTFGPSPSQYQPVAIGTSSAPMLTPVGGSQPHENRMQFLVLNYIISAQGTFPSPS